MVKRSVLVTGATGGIGKEIAKAFAREGYNIIVILGRNAEKLEALGETLRQEGLAAVGTAPVVERVVVDLADTHAVQRKVSRVIETHGSIDVLVNAAGFASQSCFLDTHVGTVEKEIKVNVLGLYAITQVVARSMVERGSGCIVNIGSLMGRIAAPTMATYSATKAAIVGFSRAIRCELEHHGIRVVLVLPTLTKTGMIEDLHTFPLMQAIDPSRVARTVIASLDGNVSEYAVGWQAHCALLVDRFFPFVTNTILSIGFHLLSKQMKPIPDALIPTPESSR